jgi:hypothetical protein
MCSPETTPELDKQKGKWVIVEKDLNLRSGLWYVCRSSQEALLTDRFNNIYYRRTRRLDTPLISDIRVVPEPPPDTLLNELLGWTKADGDLHSGVWPNQPESRLWYKLQEQDWDDWRARDSTIERQEMTGIGEVVTELDVLYGEAEPFFGFERVAGGKVLDAKPGKWDAVDIVLRKGVKGESQVPMSCSTDQYSCTESSYSYFPFRRDIQDYAEYGDTRLQRNEILLNILIVADLHYSVGNGECRDTDKEPCVGDVDTATWLAAALDAEKPDMVVRSLPSLIDIPTLTLRISTLTSLGLFW